jgi:2-oxoglutarate dehydrogenase E2 component (dihydrolipoamide succinyltransferase)
MSIEVKIPPLPESVSDAVIAAWHKKPGEHVRRDENLVDIETDKVVLEVPAPKDGILTDIVEAEGNTVVAGQLIGRLDTGEGAVAKPEAGADEPAAKNKAANASPAVRKLLAEHNLHAEQIEGTGKHGRILKEDVEHFLSGRGAAAKAAPAPASQPTAPAPQVRAPQISAEGRPEQRVPMTRLRARVAERLVQAQHNAALLTTFNEVNMQPVLDLRSRYKDSFEKRHGVRLGFMSFFVKACCEALKRFPEVNASIDGNDIVYHGFFDIGIAVSSERGLVVPILRDVDQLSAADIESQIKDYAERARDGRLDIEELTGGTFSITNGGVFGSMLSTPIINPPQSAILAMHSIKERPVVENGEIVIRPMMYLALSYDHRLIDGSAAVRFLVTVKESLEDPARILLGV